MLFTHPLGLGLIVFKERWNKERAEVTESLDAFITYLLLTLLFLPNPISKHPSAATRDLFQPIYF